MKSKILIFMATAILSTAAKAQVKPADETSIKQVVQSLQDGWNKKDGNLFASRFADDCDYVVVNGMLLKSKNTVAQGHQNIFNTFYNETSLDLNLQDARYLSDDIVIAHVTGRRYGNVGGKYEDIKAMITLTLQKKNGEWSIAAFQNTEVMEQQAQSK
ncbi:MAG: SgcJ/EcaC family oxidoreductase [Ginsengibacter sp.]